MLEQANEVICPHCGRRVTGKAAHQAGDYALCFGCGAMAVYTASNAARELTELEFAELPPLIIQQFQKALAAFRNEQARQEYCPCLRCALRRTLKRCGLSPGALRENREETR